MKILGIRNYSQGIRYCILEGDKDNYKCINLNAENKIVAPSGYLENEIYNWYKSEIKRIIDTHGKFDCITIKRNENTPSCYSKLKTVMYFDAIVTICALDYNINVVQYLYSNLKTNSKSVKDNAEAKVGKSTKYWDEKISDAIVAAIKYIES